MPEFSELSEDKRDEAYEHFKVIKPHIEDGVPLPTLAKQNDIALRTLRYWVQQYRSQGLVGLARKKRKDAGQRHVEIILQHLIEGLVLQKAALSAAAIQRKIAKVCRSYGWTIPSHSTILRIINDLDKGLIMLAQKGTKAYEDAFDLLHNRPATEANEIWQADHCWLKIFLINDKGEYERPLLTAILDDFSRAIAGYNLRFGDPTAINTSFALRQAIWRKQDPRWRICGKPDVFYTDHGSDFISKHMEQVAAHIKMELVFSEAGKPRGRGRIERFFRTITQLFLIDLPGYAPDGPPLTKPTLTLPAFKELFHEWLMTQYHTRKHGTIQQSTLERWESKAFLPDLPDSLDDLDPLLTLATTRVVQQEGIRFNKHWYQDITILSAYIGETVVIRFDPDDISELRVFYKDKFLCKVVCFELAGITISLKEVIRARKSRQRDLKVIIKERSDLVKTLLNAKQSIGNIGVIPQSQPDDPAPPSVQAEPRRKLKRYMNE